jgi:3,4-dihydroxy 2-butanone 4-phosphate synthase/GTP cyclohydrolase II
MQAPTLESPVLAAESVREALASIARGGMAVLAHDAASETGGVILMAAEAATLDSLAFINHHTSGLIRVAVSSQRAEALNLSGELGSLRKAAVGMPVDYHSHASRGLLAVDRALTARKLVDPDAKANDFVRPGHVFTVSAAPGGLFARNGYAEAAVDLAQLAGRQAGAVICDLITKTGQPAEYADLKRFATRHKLPLLNVDELLAYRRSTEPLITRVSETTMLTNFGTLAVIGFERRFESGQIVALTRPERQESRFSTVHVHNQCVSGEVFVSKLCSCARKLENAIEKTAKISGNCLIYVVRPHDRRRIGEKLKNCSHLSFNFPENEYVNHMPKEIRDVLHDLNLAPK